MSTQLFSLIGNFSVGINEAQLTDEIIANAGISTTLVSVVRELDDVFINFDANLSVAEIILLETVVASHVPSTSDDGGKVYINTEEGLTGGGDISSNVTISMDINGLINESSPNGYIAMYDTSAGAHRKVLIDNLPNTGTKKVRIGHTWGISGEIKVASGDLDFINPFFVSQASGQSSNLVSCKYKINNGTSATVSLKRNDIDIAGYTGVSVGMVEGTTDASDVTLADGDKLSLVVTAVSGNPLNLSFTVFIEHTV